MRRTYRLKNSLKFQVQGLKFLYLIPFILLFFPSLIFGNPVFTDALGRQVSPKVYPPQRIISLAPNITEILYAIGAQDQLVAVTDYCKYPPEARQKEKIGGFINPNLEKIVSLNPDLVIVTADSPQDKLFGQLERLRIPVFVINPGSLNETFQTISQIGEVCGRKENAEKINVSLRQRVAKIEEKIKSALRPKVLLLWSEDPLITAGKDTFTDDLIQLAGGINIAHDSNIKYPKYSMEEILRRKPDIIITTSMDEKSALWERWKTWTEIPAVKNKRICSMSCDFIARPAPSIVDGLEQLVKVIHPELYK